MKVYFCPPINAIHSQKTTKRRWEKLCQMSKWLSMDQYCGTSLCGWVWLHQPRYHKMLVTSGYDFFLDLLTHINSDLSDCFLAHLDVPGTSNSAFSTYPSLSLPPLNLGGLASLHVFLVLVTDVRRHPVGWIWNCVSFPDSSLSLSSFL